MQTLAILIPVYNGLDFTRKCLHNLAENIANAGFEPAEVYTIVIDDGSSDGSAAWIKQNHPEVITLSGTGDLWWSGSVNLGAQYAIHQLNADFILLWNNDILALNNYFHTIRQLVQKNNQDIIYGSKIYSNPDDSVLWSMGGKFNPKNGNFYMTAYNQKNSEIFETEWQADWLPGMGTLIPRNVFLQTGLWDQINFPHYHGDTDYTYRAKLKGFSILVSPGLVLYNDTSHSGKKEIKNLKSLFSSFSDRKSLYNIHVNFTFFKKYATSIFAYKYLINMYIRYVGGFFKWQILRFFGINKPSHA